jgi:hypothetical protein
MATVQYSDPTNEITNYPIDVHGFNPDLRTTWPMFRKGTYAHGHQGTKWVYVYATEAVTGTCTVSTSTYALTDTGGSYTATAAFASGDYGWVKQTAADLA